MCRRRASNGHSVEGVRAGEGKQRPGGGCAMDGQGQARALKACFQAVGVSERHESERVEGGGERRVEEERREKE